MRKKIGSQKIKYFFLGMLAAAGLLIVMGTTDISPPNYGRYQISAWGNSLGKDAAGVGVFIVDTATGETKTVYTRIYGDPGEGKVVKNDLKKPFYSIK